jgi:hypothetical protein
VASPRLVLYASLTLVSAGQVLPNKPHVFGLTQHRFILIQSVALTCVHIRVRGTSFVTIKLYCVRLNKLGLLNKSPNVMAATKVAITNQYYFTDRYKNLPVRF